MLLIFVVLATKVSIGKPWETQTAFFEMWKYGHVSFLETKIAKL